MRHVNANNTLTTFTLPIEKTRNNETCQCKSSKHDINVALRMKPSERTARRLELHGLYMEAFREEPRLGTPLISELPNNVPPGDRFCIEVNAEKSCHCLGGCRQALPTCWA